MATELGKAYIQLIPSARGISGKISKELDPESKIAGESAGRTLGGSMVKTAAKIIAAAGIGKMFQTALSEGGALEQSLGGIETLFKDSSDKVIKNAKVAYKTAGLSANDYMELTTSFAASLLQSTAGDTDKAADIANTAMIDMSDNANKMGTSMQDIQNAYGGFAKQNYTMLDNLKLGYGGTKTEMERLLKDARKLTGVKYDIDNLADVYEAIHVIQEELDITGTTAKEASETLSGSFTSMKGAFKNLMGNMALGENIEDELKALVKTASTFLFGNFLPMIWNVVKSLPTVILGLIREAIPAMLEGGRNMLSSLIQGIQEAIPMLMETLPGVIDSIMLFFTETLPEWRMRGLEILFGIADGIIEAIPSLFETVLSLITSIATMIGENLPLILEKGWEIIQFLANGIIERIPLAVETMLNLVGQLLNYIGENLPGFLAKGWEILQNIASGLAERAPEALSTMFRVIGDVIGKIAERMPEFLSKGWEIVTEVGKGLIENLPEILGKMGQLLTDVIQVIIDEFPNFLSKGVDLVIEIGKGLIKGIPDLLKQGRQLINDLMDEIAKIGGRMVDIGKDLVKGLWKGIGNVKDWILGKISGFVDDIIGGIKNFFGINSPSKVMANEVGKWIPEGLAGGIGDNLKPVEQAMDALGELATGSFESELAYGVSYGSSLSSRYMPSTALGEDGLSAQPPSIVIENMEVRDDSDIYRIAEELKLLFDRENRRLGYA